MKNKFNSFLFFLGIIFTILTIIGYMISGIHLWLDYSMIGTSIFLCAIILDLIDTNKELKMKVKK